MSKHISYKDKMDCRTLYDSYEEYMQNEFPNYSLDCFDVCKKCKIPIDHKMVLLGGLCKSCKEELEK